MKCKNCIYWIKHSRLSVGACDQIDFLEPEELEKDNTEKAAIELYADDDSGLTCDLWTKPDFFCGYFKEKK